VRKVMTLNEAAQLFGVEQVIVVEMIRHEWVHPEEERTLDEEDVARIRLILELRHQFGANDEAIPVILHLMDQLYYLRSQLGFLASSNNKK